ncbi:MAG: TIGR02680 family protein, partial [Solirubrobacteraceae bacterium]
EAFRALEEDGEQLAAMIEARDASEHYLTTYRTYARMATRRRAAPMRQAQTAFDRVSRDLAEAEEQHTRAQAELAAAREALEVLRAQRTRLDSRRQALQDDPAARSARELHRAGEEVEQAGRRRAEAQIAVERLQRRIADVRERLIEAVSEEGAAASDLEATLGEAAGHAGRAGVATAVAQALSETELAELRRRAEALTVRQQTAINRVRTLLQRWDQARDMLADARANTEQLVSEHAEATGRRDGGLELVRDASGAYARGVRAHLAAANELILEDPAAAFAALEAWLETVSGANPLELAASAAGRDGARRLERAMVQAGARADEARAEIDGLEREIEELESGYHPAPPAPYTRAAGMRENRAGAPLWQLVDFRDAVDPEDRAGIEAALEAAGILDGWVTPSGELLDPDTEDVLLSASDRGHGGRRLADALVPAIDAAAGVSEAEVHRLLGAIGLGESDEPVWVSVAGRFRNGVLRGAWHKPAAAFIGHTAREAARRTRLADLNARADGKRAELAALEHQLAELSRRQAQLERELAQLPSDAAVREAHSTLAAVEAELAAVTQRLGGARARERQAHAAEQEADRTLRADAEDLGLPPAGDRLAEVEAALASLRETLAALWPARARRDRAERARMRAAEDVDATEAEHAETASRLAEAEHQFVSAAERRDTLQATAGAAIAELERRLREVAVSLTANAAGQRDTEARLGHAQRADGAAEALRRELGHQLEAVAEERLGAVEGLRRFATTGLIAVALPEIGVPDAAVAWNVTQALRLAREIEQAASGDGEEDARWQRLQRQVTDELGALADALRRHGNNASASFREEGVVVEVTFRGHATSLPALSAALAEEVEERQRLLDAHEREILENHLVGEVASTLQE